jgi:hypothetical protein
MTSEVALLNKTCVALAADSATTVTYWEGGTQVRRYFKGANKIFNLSVSNPVGLMTFASASLQGVPWEVIVKAYRDQAGPKKHDELPDYATDFFAYVSKNSTMFPPATQERQFMTLADRAAAAIVSPILNNAEFKAAPNAASQTQVFHPLLWREIERVEKASFVPGANQQDADAATARLSSEVQAMLEADRWYADVPRIAFIHLAPAAILGVYKSVVTSLQSTGLAFAGYGEKDYFPRMEVHRVSGMVLGKLLCEKESEVRVDHENTSDLVPLAMTEMIGTFIWGISDSGLMQIDREFRTQAKVLIEGLKDDGHIDPALDVAKQIKDAAHNHVSALVEYFGDSHQAPLRRVIANLAFSELAELAETMVFMESMKERVTSPAQSVSGPIDVAIISKGDGFIWIKRKHYFVPELNPRFFQRHQNS